MSDIVTVPAHTVVSASLPNTGMCVLHAQPATATRSTTFRSKTPGWVWLFIVVGVLIALIISEAVAKKVTGPVPECVQCIAERKKRRSRLVTLWIVSAVLFVAVIAFADASETISAVLALVMLVTFLWALVQLVINGRRGVKGVVSKDGLWVDLSCAPAFAAACQERMAAAAQVPATPPA